MFVLYITAIGLLIFLVFAYWTRFPHGELQLRLQEQYGSRKGRVVMLVIIGSIILAVAAFLTFYRWGWGIRDPFYW